MLEPGRPLTMTYPTLAGFRTRALNKDGGGRAVILLHGFSDRADTWGGVIDHLTRSGIRAVAVDLPGFGAADPLSSGPLFPQFDTFVADAVDRWTRDGLPPVLVGNSLGGLLAMRAAQDPTLCLGGVVLVSPAGLVHSRWIHLLQAVHKVNPLLFRPVVPMSAYRWLAARGFAYLAGGGVPLVDGYARHFSDQFVRPADVPRVFAKVPQLISELSESWDLEIAPSSLVLWGRHDRLTKIEGADRLRPLLSDGAVRILDDCGHCPQLQLPDVVAGHIADFSRTLDRSDGLREASGSAT